MKRIIRSLSLCMVLLLIIQLLVPFSALAEGPLAPSLKMNGGGKYTVGSVEDLNALRGDIDKGIDYAGKIVILTQDIDLSHATALNSFTTQNTFSGCFDGGFHTISGYTDAKSGLFSLIDVNGEVRNLRLEAQVDITDSSTFINDSYYDPDEGGRPYGLIANESAGLIVRCSTTGELTIHDASSVGGIAGYSYLRTQFDGAVSDLNGKITDCFSNVVFNNQVSESETVLSTFCGIAYYGGEIEHCYYYGQFIGNPMATVYAQSANAYKKPIRNSKGSENNCAYDSDVVLGPFKRLKAKGYTTAQMKTKDSYTALGFDFDKCWSIDPDINGGYPYLDPLKKGESDQEVADRVAAQIGALPDPITLNDQNSVKTARTAYDALSAAQKLLVSNLEKLTAAEARIANLNETVVKIPVDIQVSVADKTYNPALSEADNFLTNVTGVQIKPVEEKNAQLIEDYKVKVNYDGAVAKFTSRTMGEQPVSVTFDKLTLTYTPNDVYQFTINKVLSATANFLDNGQPGPAKAKQAEQVALAKQAQEILYSKLGIGQGQVPAFTWSGDQAAAPGKEGTIVFNDSLKADTWGIFSAARSGYTGVRPRYYDEWFQSIQTGLQRMKEAGIGPQDVKMTEWEKLVLAITAIGYDPRDIEAYDLIDIISNGDYLSASKQYFSRQYALLTLESLHYSIPKNGNRIDPETWIHTMAEQTKGTKGADGSPVAGNTAPDMWVMQFQPIAAYYHPDAQAGDQYYDVKEAMERVFAQFSKAQTYAGYFSGGLDNVNNPWTNAQVYITLGMAKADLFDGKYIKNGNSIFDGALGFYDFANNSTSFDETTYEPAQIGRGLDALVRAYEGRNDIFDCTDVVESTVHLNNAVEALPETVTRDDQAAVEAAQVLYDGLSADQKSSLQSATKAKLAAAQLAVRDPSFPVISIKDLADQPLTEDKTVTAAEFRFKVIVEDKEDGTCNPSVEFNGTPLEAGDDGTYSCRLSSGNNTLTVTATDTDGHQVKKSLSVILEAASLLTPPGLSPDSTDNIPGEAVELTFGDNPAWRYVISGVTMNGGRLSDDQYTITAGKIQIHAGVMTTAGNYLIAVMAAGYTDAVVNQVIESDSADLGTVKVRVADNVPRLASEVGSLGENYRQPFGEILAQTEVEITPGLTIRGAIEKALATKAMKVFGAANYISGVGPVTSADGKRTVAKLSEFNGGDQSGWMITLNDWFINSSASDFIVKDGDVVELCYTCNLGADISGDFSNPDTSLKSLIVSPGTLTPEYSPGTKNYVLTLPAAAAIMVTPTAANKTNKVIIQSGDTTYRRTDNIAAVDRQIITITCAGNSYKITISVPGNTSDQDRANGVSALIAALPNIDQLTLGDKNLVEAAREAYEVLSDSQKKLVTNLARLTAAEEIIERLLEGDEKADLNRKIAEAKLLTETQYTPESWAVFAEKLSTAKLVTDNAAATQTEVSTALENLIKAINDLKLREGGSKQAEVHDILTVVSGSMKGSGADWDVVDMAAYGQGGAMNKATLTANALAIYNDGEYTPAATEYERVAIALTSLGIDARSVDNGTKGKANFIEKIAQYNANVENPSLGTINAYIFALLAYDSGNYELTPTANWTREKIITYLLSKQLADGGWALSGSSGDPDVTAMAISALAKYRDNQDVAGALTKAVNCLSIQQTAKGGFKSWGTENSNSAAMAIVALSALGIDADQDSRFVKEGKSVLDALLSYKTEDNRLGYVDTTYNDMATEQGFRALVAYSKLLKTGEACNIYIFGTPSPEESLFEQNQAALNVLDNLTDEQQAAVALPEEGNAVNPDAADESILSAADGLKLVVPAGALSGLGLNEEVTFTVGIGNVMIPPSNDQRLRVLDPLKYQRRFTLATTSGAIQEGTADFGDHPITLTFPIEVNALPSGITPGQLAVYWWNPDSQKWVKVEGSTFDPETKTLSVPVHHFSTYAVMADIGKPVTRLSIPATASLKVEETTQLTVTVTPSDATDPRLSWSSSDSTVVSVDGNGKLTAKKAGTATITVEALDGSGVKALCAVTVTAASSGGGTTPDTKISVSFTLKGDSVHKTPEKHTAFQTWIAKTTVSVAKNTTVYDVFDKVLGDNGIQYKESQSNYIGRIKAPASFGGYWLSEFDNGPNSGWMYMVNGKHPHVGLRDYKLKDGDAIVWHYTDDYTKEEGSEEWNDTTGGSGSNPKNPTKPLPEDTPVTADPQILNQLNQGALAVLKNLTAEQKAQAALPANAPQLIPGASIETLLTATDGVRLRVPAGALNNQSGPLTLSIGIGTITTPPQGESGIRVLNPLHYQRQFDLVDSAGPLAAGAANFTAPVTLTFPIKTGELPEGATTGQLAVYRWNPDRETWVRLGGVFDALSNTLSVPTYHLSTYAVMADQSPAPQRLAGTDRYLTAKAVADQGWKTGADEVVLVNAVTFADALAAGPLAFKLNAPILLTDKDTLTPSTREELQRLGVKRITLIGGTGVIAQGIETELQAAYGAENVRRYGGYDRYETAALIAAALGTTGQAVLANGEDGHYSDALAISSYAAYHGIPILFTETGALPEATAQALAAQKIGTTLVVGGEAVIPASIYNQLPGASRYAGMDSYATAAAIAEGLKLNPNRTYIATGLNFADALTAGNLAAQTLSPLLMVDRNVPQVSADYLSRQQGKISELVIIGGEGIIRADQESVLRSALNPAAPSSNQKGGTE